MSSEKEAKLKALKLTLDKLDKTYGKGAVMKMGDTVVEDVEVIPSGSLGLDIALGVGGYPRGRVYRDLRSGVFGKDHTYPSRHSRSTKKWRYCCFY